MANDTRTVICTAPCKVRDGMTTVHYAVGDGFSVDTVRMTPLKRGIAITGKDIDGRKYSVPASCFRVR